jgi:hypothetical protein
MKTRFDIIKYVVTLRDVWEKMSELSENEKDINYFDSRISVDNDVLDYLNDDSYWQNNYEYDYESFNTYLLNSFTNAVKDNVHFYNENDFYNETYSGCSDEYRFLHSITEQQYWPTFHIENQLLKTTFKIYE